MNRIYLLLFMPICALFSCSNDEILSVSKELNVAIVQAVTPTRAFVGDTVRINLIASINDDQISRIEILEVPDKVEDLRDEIRFTMIDNTIPMEMDDNGNLSRQLNSLMMIHPIVIDKDASLFNQSLVVTYRVTSLSGEQKTISANIQITNYINNTVMLPFLLADAQKGMFFDPIENKSYDRTNYKANIDKIEMVIYADKGKKYHCLNPAAPETETILKELGITDYKASEMRATKLVNNPPINYYLLTDVELKALTFETSVNKVSLITDQLAPFMTQDNKKGCLRAKIVKDNFNAASKMEAVIR